MPIIKSAKKRARQTTVRRQRNVKTKRAMREAIKTVETSVADGKKADAAKNLPLAYSAIDTALKKNLIHKNKAARKKSQLNAAVKSISAAKAPAKKPATKKTAAKPKTAKK